MSHDNSINEPLHILQFPDIILEQVMGNFSYHEIAMMRIVCVRFNEINKSLLNRGFHAAEHFHMKCQKEVKGELPRRESERRDHPLAHHCNILSGIETRLSLLNMTFLKYMDAKFCCFIPGKVIDELFRVLRFVQSTKNIFIKGGATNDAKNSILKELRANVILKELRDISSMAMEHFEENILPNFKAATSTPLLSFSISTPQHFTHAIPSYDSTPVSSHSLQRIEFPAISSSSPDDITSICSLKVSSKENKTEINALKKQISGLQSKLSETRRKLNEQEQVVLELNRVLSEQMSKLGDHDSKLAEINRTLSDSENKVATATNMLISKISKQAFQSSPLETIHSSDSKLKPSTSFAPAAASSFPQQAFLQLVTYFLHSGLAHSAVSSPSNFPTDSDLKTNSEMSGDAVLDCELKRNRKGPRGSIDDFSSSSSSSSSIPLTRNTTRKRKNRNEMGDTEKQDTKSKKIR